MDPSPETKSLAVLWASFFEKVGATGPPQAWLDLHSSTVVYSDHAFRVRRKGRAGIADHFATWKRANPDFRMEVKDVWPELQVGGKRRLSFEFNASGTFLNDVAQAMKASGRSFGYQGRIDMTINAKSGLIDAIDEYYPYHFDAGKSVEDYRKRDEEWN